MVDIDEDEKNQFDYKNGPAHKVRLIDRVN